MGAGQIDAKQEALDWLENSIPVRISLTSNKLGKLSEHVYVSKYCLARIQAGLGDKDKASEI
jgi:hypothetical protein